MWHMWDSFHCFPMERKWLECKSQIFTRACVGRSTALTLFSTHLHLPSGRHKYLRDEHSWEQSKPVMVQRHKFFHYLMRLTHHSKLPECWGYCFFTLSLKKSTCWWIQPTGLVTPVCFIACTVDTVKTPWQDWLPPSTLFILLLSSVGFIPTKSCFFRPDDSDTVFYYILEEYLSPLCIYFPQSSKH